MARTRNQSILTTLPDAPPAGTIVTLRVEDGGSWSVVVEIPLPAGGTLTQVVRPGDVTVTKGNRATTCAEDIYDKAAQLAGFSTA